MVDVVLYIIGSFVFLPICGGLVFLLISCVPEKTEGAKDLLFRITALGIPILVTGCFSLGLILLADYRFGEVNDVNLTVAIAFTVVGSILIVLTLVFGVTIRILQRKKKSTINSSKN